MPGEIRISVSSVAVSCFLSLFFADFRARKNALAGLAALSAGQARILGSLRLTGAFTQISAPLEICRW